MAISLVADDRRLQAASGLSAAPPLGSFADIRASGFLVQGPEGLRRYAVGNSRLSSHASTDLALGDGGLVPVARCVAATCAELVVTTESGFAVDADAPPRWSKATSTPFDGPAQVEIVHADATDDYLAVVFDVTARHPAIVAVNKSERRQLAVGAGPGAEAMASRSEAVVAVTTGTSDLLGARQARTHWLRRDALRQWNVVEETQHEEVLCLSDDGSRVVVRENAAFLEASGGTAARRRLPIRPQGSSTLDRPCVLHGDEVVTGIYLDGGGLVQLDGGQFPLRPWAAVWAKPGTDPLAWRLEARQLALSPAGTHVASIDKANDVVVQTRDGVRAVVGRRMLDIAFLASGDLVMLPFRGTPVVVTQRSLP